MERVTEKVARDYRDHIPGEMFLTLISERVVNNYYRSVDQIFADLDQIHENSRVYNSDINELTMMARKMGDGIKKAIRQALSSSTNLCGSNDDDSRKHDKSAKIAIDNSSGGRQGPENPLIKSKSLQQTTNLMNGGRKAINDNESDADMEPYKRSDNHMKVTLPQLPRQVRQYQEEQKLVDPLIQHLNSNRDEDPLVALAGTKRGRRLTRRAAAEISESMPESSTSKITIKLGSTTVQPPLSSSIVDDVNLIGKSTRSGRGRRVARANLKEDSESDFNDLD